MEVIDKPANAPKKCPIKILVVGEDDQPYDAEAIIAKLKEVKAVTIDGYDQPIYWIAINDDHCRVHDHTEGSLRVILALHKKMGRRK